MKYFKWGCLGLLTLFVLAAGFAIFTSGYGTSPTGQGLSVGGIPSHAQQVEYYIPPPFSPMGSAEFDIDEKGYLEWVAARQQRVSGLSKPVMGPTSIIRYDPKSSRFVKKSISNGWAATWSHTDQGLYLMYDLDLKRAYYCWHSR